MLIFGRAATLSGLARRWSQKRNFIAGNGAVIPRIMGSDVAKSVADELNKNGMAKLNMEIGDDFVKKAHTRCHKIFDEATALAKKAHGTGTFPVGMEHGFNEIVHRANGRYDCQHGVNGHPDFQKVAEMWEPFIDEVLGGRENWEMQFNGTHVLNVQNPTHSTLYD